jgi:hypothetical protein
MAVAQPFAAQCPAPGSGSAGVAAWTAANCGGMECSNSAITCNGSFSINFLGSSTIGTQTTFGYQVCQLLSGSALSHWVISLNIPCLAEGSTLNQLVVAATLNQVPINPVVGLDPTTQLLGIKFNEGVAQGSCNEFTVTFETAALAADYILGEGCVTAVTKAGNQDIRNAARSSPGYACIVGPVCELASLCWAGETAWSAGTPYNANQGNWATFTPYNGATTVVNLWAGQVFLAGSVIFSDVDLITGNVLICVSLNPGFRFKAVSDNLKIQGYAIAPSGNPAPGQFPNKYDANTNPYCVLLPAANFFGIHIDVERVVPCP